jgi:hypothetical protein
MLKGVVVDVIYFPEHRCSVYTLSKNGKEVVMTLTDTERANNRYNEKLAKAVEELNDGNSGEGLRPGDGDSDSTDVSGQNNYDPNW